MSRSVYRAIYSRLFDDADFQKLSPRARLVLLTLRQCEQAGPGAIFRYYAEVLARQTGLRAREIASALVELDRGGWTKHDALVVWVRNGLRFELGGGLRNPNIRRSVEKLLDELPRSTVATSFCIYYDLRVPSRHPPKGTSSTDTDTETETDTRSSTALGISAASHDAPLLDSHAQSGVNTESSANGVAPSTSLPIPSFVVKALDRMPLLGPQLRDARWWYSELRAHPQLDLVSEALRAEAWCTSNPQRAPRRAYRRFLHSWFLRAAESAR